jgi:superfamily II DNA or RNA helicase
MIPQIDIIFSIRILDEAIDLPRCDSVFFTYPSNSRTRSIQRVCRAVRLDERNPSKRAQVFLWCDEFDEVAETLSALRDNDAGFDTATKVRINKIDQDGVISARRAFCGEDRKTQGEESEEEDEDKLENDSD